MNRTALSDTVARMAQLPKGDANDAVEAVFDAITDALRAGEEIRIKGFGTFAVTERAAKEGRNPRTGEKIQVAAARVARFKPGKTLRQELNPPAPSIPRHAAGGRR